MTINRDFWLQPFYSGNFPNWNCPRCDKGILHLVINSFKYWESADSHAFGRKFFTKNRIEFDDNKMLGMEVSEYCYSVLLKCDNPSCQESVASCGSGHVMEDYVDELGEMESFDVFVPEYFYPSLNLFAVSEKCPETVMTEIKGSFKLFFADPSAAANYVRKAVEEILTNKGVARFTTSKRGKRVRISLHDRILSFEMARPDIAKKLFAIKWLGNEGSHTDTISKNDVLDAYEILEWVLDDLYVGYRKQLENKVSKINKTKKPLHPST